MPRTCKGVEDAFAAAANLKPPQAHILIDPNALERKFALRPVRNQAIVREFRKVMDEGYTDSKGVLRKPLLGKTIVFAVTKRHAETLATMIDNEFAHLKPSPEIKYADYVVSGMGQDEDTTDGMTRIRRFKKEKFPQVLGRATCSPWALTARKSSIWSLRAIPSPFLLTARCAAGKRKAQGKPIFTLFDFVGVELAQALGEDGYAEGGKVIESKPSPYYSPRTLVTVNQDDDIDPTTRAWVTMDDAGNFRS